MGIRGRRGRCRSAQTAMLGMASGFDADVLAHAGPLGAPLAAISLLAALLALGYLTAPATIAPWLPGLAGAGATGMAGWALLQAGATAAGWALVALGAAAWVGTCVLAAPAGGRGRRPGGG